MVGKFDPESGTCAVLVLTQSHADASMGLTLSENWVVEATSLWRSTTADCAARTTSKGAVAATSAAGSVTINYPATTTLDIDAVLSFPASDAGPAQSVELKAQGVDIRHSC